VDIAAWDENVGWILAWLDAQALTENTLAVKKSGQIVFTGDYGGNDKRWMSEGSVFKKG
jgi:hypothetical protein